MRRVLFAAVCILFTLGNAHAQSERAQVLVRHTQLICDSAEHVRQYYVVRRYVRSDAAAIVEMENSVGFACVFRTIGYLETDEATSYSSRHGTIIVHKVLIMMMESYDSSWRAMDTPLEQYVFFED
ncbi:MAG TPA: hypothetical protein VGP13_02975, partial [Candidatus Paceibacterota bacterium]|nr:hypothetical protein [Candidatus Paceibacterota bacterium]